MTPARTVALLLILPSLLIFALPSTSSAQDQPAPLFEIVQLSPEESRAILARSSPPVTLDGNGPLTIEQILVFQLHLLNMQPPIQFSPEGMLYFIYVANTAFYLTIGAERLGVGFTFVAQNFYIAAALIPTVVAIRFNMAALGITPGTPWPVSALLRIYFHYGLNPNPNPHPQFAQYDLPVMPLDDDASNGYADETPAQEPQISQPNPEPNFNSPVTSSTHFGCTVPNIDLDNRTNPAGGGYAGDRNACGPTAASNSLKWLQSLYPNINIPFSHRALLDSLSRYMQRQPGGGVSIENFIRGKVDFIRRHNLPIQVKFQAQGVAGNIVGSDGQTMARNDNSGAYPTWQYLKQEVADTEDVELFYKWWDGSQWRGHVVAVTGVYETQSGKRYVGMKHDIKQGDTGGTVQEYPEITTDANGRMILHRHGRPRYVSHIVSESPGTPFTPPTGVGDRNGIPDAYRLAQNYPNPFNPETRIDFDIPEGRSVRITLFDILGREVKTLTDAHHPPGTHSVYLDASSLASGVYLYRMQAGSFSATKRLTVLR